MMAWQLDSVLGGDRGLPVEVAATKQEWSGMSALFAEMSALRLRGEKRALEAVLPDGFVRAVLAKSDLSCFVTSDGKYLRSRSYAGTDRRMSALDVYARFGGTVLEEVFERGMTEVGERKDSEEKRTERSGSR
jgi:hypothetical protein